MESRTALVVALFYSSHATAVKFWGFMNNALCLHLSEVMMSLILFAYTFDDVQLFRFCMFSTYGQSSK